MAILILASLSKWDKCLSLLKLICDPSTHETLEDIVTRTVHQFKETKSEDINIEKSDDTKPIINIC